MIIGRRRGQHMAKLADENRRLVLDHFLNNPDSTIAQAAQECGLSTTSIKTHVKTINAGWRPDGWEGK